MGFRGFRQYRDRLTANVRNESGQSIILISVVILSFLMFFSFAINTGLLINAKISVQNAADAAAYAGAAVQARELNAISFLNYDMREQYKKFIFRYAFIGSMGSAEFPLIRTGATGPDYDFEKIDTNLLKVPGNPFSQRLGLKVPVICIPLTANGSQNDNCRVLNLTNTAATLQASNTSGVNPIQDTAIQGLIAIANAQQEICKGQGDINLFAAMAWLFRADLTQNQLMATIQSLTTQSFATGQADAAQIVANISPLMNGLGLYPRNIVTMMRAHTLEGFLNQKHEVGVTSDAVDSWSTAQDSDARERTIQAFRSAQANLNSSVFDQSLLQMDEMQADNLISLGNVLTTFNVYIQHMSPDSNATSTPVTVANPKICVSQIDPFPAIGVPVGVNVNSLQVNYGVHLKAFIKPHGLMYLPNSDALELDAYAGAKPFGGRIGPAVNLRLTESITPASIYNSAAPPILVPINDCTGTAKCDVPNLDLIGTSVTSYNTAFLTELVNQANGGSPTAPYTTAGLTVAQQSAMAPNPTEVGHYNILPPPKAAGAMQFDYIPYSLDASGIYRFYAPVFPAGGADVSGTVAAYLDKIFPKTEIGTADNPFGMSMEAMRSSLQTFITAYIQTALASGNPSLTENGETTTFAALTLPMPSGLKPSTTQSFWLTQATQVSSSWAPGSPTSRYTPRFGYSVKFATLHDLQKEGLGAGEDDLDAVAH
jgi:hypothetical protein